MSIFYSDICDSLQASDEGGVESPLSKFGMICIHCDTASSDDDAEGWLAQYTGQKVSSSLQLEDI